MSVLNTKTDRPLKAVLLAVLVILAGIGAKKGLAALKKPAQVRTPPPTVIAATAQIVTMGDLRPQVEGHGRIRSLESLDLVPEVGAVLLPQNFSLRSGSSFRAGQILARLDDTQAANLYRSAVGDMLNALAGILPDLRADWPEQAPTWEGYFQQLSFDSLPPLPAMPEGPARLFLARHRIFQMHFQASNLLQQWRKHVLRAPFSGTVASSNASPGALARIGTPLARLVRTDILEMEVPLPAGLAESLKPGLAVEVRLSSTGAELVGTVDRVSGVLDERSQNRSVFVRLRGTQGGVLDGMYGVISLESPPIAGAWALPRTALWQGDKAMVVRGGLLELAPVLIAQTDMEMAYITAGLQEGDTVITASLQDPMTGMRIRPLLPQGEAR